MAPRLQRLLIRHTLLVVVEGETEFAFCNYLKGLLSRNRNIAVTISNARGGSPGKIIDFAVKRMLQAQYDKIVIVLDGDQPISVKSLNQTKQLRADLVIFEPCIEGWFLQLLEGKTGRQSLECKKRFHAVCLDETSKLKPECYAGLFPLSSFRRYRKDAKFAVLVDLFSAAAFK